MSKIDKKAMFSAKTKCGFVVNTEVRPHDKQVLVIVRHDEDIIKLMPVDTDEELSQWFWKYIEDFGGEAEE